MISTENKIKRSQTDILESGGAASREPKTVVADINGEYIIVAEDFSTKFLIFNSGETIDVVFSEGLIPDQIGEIIAITSNNTVLNFVPLNINVLLTPIQGATLSIEGEGVWGAKSIEPDTYSVYGTLDAILETPIVRDFVGTALSLQDVSGFNYNYDTPSAATTYTYTNPVTNGFARAFINVATEPVVTGATKIVGATFIPSVVMEMRVSSPNGTAVEYYFIER